MKNFGEYIVPSVVNFSDPDTAHYPIFVEFDALFVRTLWLSKGVNDCPPSPITMVAVLERLIEGLIGTNRQVWILVTNPVFQVVWDANATFLFLRKLLLDFIRNQDFGLLFQSLETLEELKELILDRTPQIYITQDFSDAVYFTRFPKDDTQALMDRFYLLECFYLTMEVALLTTNELDFSLKRIATIEVNSKAETLSTLLQEVKLRMPSCWSGSPWNWYEVDIHQTNHLEKILDMAQLLVSKDLNIAAWKKHRELIQVLSISQRSISLKEDFPLEAYEIIAAFSKAILMVPATSYYQPSEFIDLYDTKLLALVLLHGDEIREVIPSASTSSTVTSNVHRIPPIFKDLQHFSINVSLVDNQAKPNASNLGMFLGNQISHQHWHSKRLLEDDFAPKEKTLKQLRNAQFEAKFNQKFGESFITSSKFEKRMILVEKETTQSLTQSKEENCINSKGKSSKKSPQKQQKPKKGVQKISKSAQVKERVALELQKKNDEKTMREFDIIDLQLKKMTPERAIRFLEEQISNLPKKCSNILEVNLYRRLCELLFDSVKQKMHLPDQIALFAAARDFWRFQNENMGKETKEFIWTCFELLEMKNIREQLTSSSQKPADNTRSVYFQLMHCGHLLPRKVDAVDDDRVSKYFVPDRWQVEMLNAVDSHHSLLVSAPTSSGKTFVSYYCIEEAQRLRKKVVFVVPTKALVNQIRADIYNRYGRIYAVFTRDERNDNVMTADVLITVPQILEMLLLSSTGQKWAKSLHYGILDEIHSIGDQESGSCWERALAVIPCPVVCLSATIGNFPQFSKWLEGVQKAKGFKLCSVLKHDRWNDLHLSHYNGAQTEQLDTKSSAWQLHKLVKTGNDFSNFPEIHPLGLLATPNGWTMFK
jgi:hypothetical protein